VLSWYGRSKQPTCGLYFVGRWALFVIVLKRFFYVFDAEYRDHANEDVPSTVPLRFLRKTTTTGEPIATFPMILHELLERAEPRGYASIVRWQEHGRAFRIYNRKGMIEKVLPLYFERQGAYTSFQRQLNSYGFLRLNADGPDQKAYYHELLLRGKAQLAVCMVRGSSSSGRVRRRWDPTTEPNLSELEPLPPSSWRSASSLGPQEEKNSETVFSLQLSEAASKNEPKRQKREATLDHEERLVTLGHEERLLPLSRQPCSHKQKTSDSDLLEPIDVPQCSPLDPLPSSQRIGYSSNNYSPVPPNDPIQYTNSQCARDQTHGFYHFERNAGTIEQNYEAQSLDCALQPRWLAANRKTVSTAQERPVDRATTGCFGSDVVAAALAPSPSVTELVGQHDSAHSAAPSTESFTYDRLFSDRLLRSTAALPVQLAATTATASDSSTVRQFHGYTHHTLMHVNNPGDIASLGSSQGSISLTS
jgi:HSF-type DNA-binding